MQSVGLVYLTHDLKHDVDITSNRANQAVGFGLPTNEPSSGLCQYQEKPKNFTAVVRVAKHVTEARGCNLIR